MKVSATISLSLYSLLSSVSAEPIMYTTGNNSKNFISKNRIRRKRALDAPIDNEEVFDSRHKRAPRDKHIESNQQSVITPCSITNSMLNERVSSSQLDVSYSYEIQMQTTDFETTVLDAIFAVEDAINKDIFMAFVPFCQEIENRLLQSRPETKTLESTKNDGRRLAVEGITTTPPDLFDLSKFTCFS